MANMTHKTGIYDFESGKAFVLKGRDKISRPLCNNTRVYLYDNAVAIRLHQTDVVTFYENGEIEFSSGGWRTMTTSDRLNAYNGGGYRIFSDKGQWRIYKVSARKAALTRSVKKHGAELSEWGNYKYGTENTKEQIKAIDADLRKAEHVFFDGMRFSKGGKLLNPRMTPAQEEREAKKVEKFRLSIRKYARAAADRLKDPIPATDTGDCFYCQFDVKGEGDCGNEHYRSHLEEGYIPTAMYARVFSESRYSEMAQSWFVGYNPETGTIGGSRANREIIEAEFYRFMMRRFLPERAGVPVAGGNQYDQNGYVSA